MVQSGSDPDWKRRQFGRDEQCSHFVGLEIAATHCVSGRVGGSGERIFLVPKKPRSNPRVRLKPAGWFFQQPIDRGSGLAFVSRTKSHAGQPCLPHGLARLYLSPLSSWLAAWLQAGASHGNGQVPQRLKLALDALLERCRRCAAVPGKHHQELHEAHGIKDVDEI
jgi:hypothetical protein